MENQEDSNRPENTEAGAQASGKQMPFTVDYCPRKTQNLVFFSNGPKIAPSLLNFVNTLHVMLNAELGFKNTILNM
jgi:hypothetical protein